jgi:lipopolysaccharide heptosyltransferase II
MTMAYERVLIVLLGAIGDVVRALPLATRLRAAWPKAKLMWAVEPAAAPIVDRHPALDSIIRFNRPEGARELGRFLRVVRACRADLTLDLQRHLKSGLTSWYSGAATRIGFAAANSREGNWLFNNQHIAPVERFSPKVEQFQAFADYLEAPPAPVSFGLRLQPDEEVRVAELLSAVHGPFAVLFMGSTWPSRSWFSLPTANLCKELRTRGFAVVLVGARSEEPFAREVVEAGAEAVNLVGRTSLRDVIGILARATIAVGPDSGPMHISAAVGTPVVSLWGATSPARSAPYGSENLVVRGDVPCAPCYLRRCPIGRLCMEEIRLEMVLSRVDEALQKVSEEGGLT